MENPVPVFIWNWIFLFKPLNKERRGEGIWIVKWYYK